MTIRHMKIFLEVYRTENITKAAEHLHMTQPAVTRTIQEIENYYGVRLFERINRRLYVTETGKQFYKQALHIVDSFDNIEKTLRNWDTFGVLRVGSSITLGNFVLPELVCRFKENHPNIKIYANVSNGSNLQKALLNNHLDLALVEGEVSEADLMSEQFYSDQLILIMPVGHPLMCQEKIYLSDLSKYDLLLREKGSAGRIYIDSVFAVHGISVTPLWESVSTQAIIKAVSKGIGIALLPEMLVKKDIENGIICTKKIEDVIFKRKNYIVWHKNKYFTKAADDFKLLCENFSDT